jgi:hypothetical protein
MRTLILAVLAILFVVGCSPTKYVPKGKQLLVRNQIIVNGETAKDANAKAIIKQKPNKKVELPVLDWVLWRPYLQLYNLGNPEKEKGFSHWLTDIGEPPTVLDSNAMFNSGGQIGMYYFNKGYFNNQVEVDVDYFRDSTRAICTYTVYSGPQYYFGNVEYVVTNQGVSAIIQRERSKSQIKTGTPYSAAVLEEERSRLVTILRNSGYYGYPKTLIRFDADTSAGNHTVGVRLVVADQPASVGDSIFYIELQPYTIRKVDVRTNYNFSDPYSFGLDTAEYLGLTILQDSLVYYTNRYIESAIHFKKDSLYREKDVRETYAHLSGNRVFQIAEISFEPVIGDSNNVLDALIRLQPYNRYTLTTELEGTTTSGNYGIEGIVTLAWRNIFHGGEILDLSFNGGLQAQVNVQENNIFNTMELGTELGLNFPRFLFFGKLNSRIPKRMEPKSRIYTSYSYQTRVEFERTIFSVGLLYNWRESRTKLHQINLIDFNYVYLPRIDQDYLNSLEFKTGFQNNLITATRYTFVYDNQKYTKTNKSEFLRTSIEGSGNLLSLINTGQFNYDEEKKQYEMLGVPYSQYIKVDADFRNYFQLTKDHQIATRLYAGSTFTYGNTPYLPPFEKSFLAGGSNDIRGWVAYRLGPGNFPDSLYEVDGSSYAAVAPLKLMASFEYRFTVIKSLKSALFFDAGNIWLYNKNFTLDGTSDVEKALIENGVFKFDTFYKQLALNTGIGLRYDFGFFAFRLDLGIRIFDPTFDKGSRYVLPQTKWNNINYNIALGYPF